MKRMRVLVLTLLACLPSIASGHGPAASERPESAEPKKALGVPVPSPLPPSRPREPKPPHPEFGAAIQAARQGEILLRNGHNEEALDHFLETIGRAPATMPSYAGNALYLQMLVVTLANRHLDSEAEWAVSAFLQQPVPGSIESHASALARTIDLGLYLAAGREDVGKVLSLLDRRATLKGILQGMCPNGTYFPDVVAPTHHDARVAAKLRGLGCPSNVIAQMDELASKPMGPPLSLPRRPRASGGTKLP